MIDLYNYLLQTNPDELIKDGKDCYRLKSHHSLVISNGKWYWFSHNFGGYNALQYLMKVENYAYQDAKQAIEQIDATKLQPIPKKKYNQLFFLPRRSHKLDKLYDYLVQQRKIDIRVILDCIDQNIIYLDEKEENIVFVGYDQDHIPRFACKRNIYTKQKKDVRNSNKAYSFHITGESSSLHVFESPIDLLSYLSILKQQGLKTNDHYLSLGGLSDKALHQYLSAYKIKQIIFHLDNDDAGKQATNRFIDTYQEQYETKYSYVDNYKDLNEFLIDYQERIQSMI